MAAIAQTPLRRGVRDALASPVAATVATLQRVELDRRVHPFA